MNTRGQFPDDPELCYRIATNIREIRRIRHLTQVELARRVGIQTPPLNAIEHGKHIPTGRVLYRMAEVLQVSIDTLMGRKPADVLSAGPSASASVMKVAEAAAPYGEQVAGDDGDWPRAQEVELGDEPVLDDVSRLRVSAVCRAFLALEDLCGAQKCAHIPLYYPFAATETGMESLAGQVRQFLGIGQAVVFDYLELLENAGVRIVFCPLSGDVDSAAFYDPVNANAFLIIRSDMNVERQLFELAKRLGSIYLHTQRVQMPRRMVTGGDLDDVHAARKFAALFLMPAAAVRASVAQLGVRPEGWTYDLLLRLKHRFGVSAQAFLLRLRELELIAPEADAAIDARIKAHYSRTNYREPDASRRILSPNGRLGDLLLVALEKPESRKEAQEIAGRLKKAGVRGRAER